MRLCLKLAYVGTGYYGWQVQAQGQALRTVQGQLERALALLAREPVRAHGSGRTDAGVHAEEQVCHCDFPDERYAAMKDMRHSLNSLLPDDISVYSVTPAKADFHARFDAHTKTYRYQFWQDRGAVPPRLAPYVWKCGPLDAGRMQGALPLLQGRHDFACLANAGTERESTVREILSLTLAETRPRPELAPMLLLDVTGPGFLKQMVRNMAGLLADIGRGRLEARDIPRFLAGRSMALVPSPTAPARGLTLLKVTY
ncbi:MAG: tRNA pseudouridine(38-40) synthase TruA [Desulfovibrionaceae bacterium]|nr:tRNA pseudouridine(38-40) synthase TruA [Desulfovibrionaceae bacterium]